MSGINAGRLKQWVVIEEQVESKGAMGGTAKTWQTFVTTRAHILHASGSDLTAAGQNQSVVKARAKLRYVAGITPKMRLVDDGVVYSIEAVIDRDARRRVLELVLSQGLNDG